MSGLATGIHHVFGGEESTWRAVGYVVVALGGGAAVLLLALMAERTTALLSATGKNARDVWTGTWRALLYACAAVTLAAASLGAYAYHTQSDPLISMAPSMPAPAARWYSALLRAVL